MADDNQTMVDNFNNMPIEELEDIADAAPLAVGATSGGGGGAV